MEHMSIAHGHDLNLNGERVTAVAGRTAPRRFFALCRKNASLIRFAFMMLAVLCDFSAIMISAVGAGWLYHHLFFGTATPINDLMIQGCIISILFTVPTILRGEYTTNRYLLFSGHVVQITLMWNIALLMAVAQAFLTKTSEDVSRGSAILFYIGGFCTVCLVRLVLVRVIRAQAQAGVIANRRVFLIGFENDVQSFMQRHKPWTQGIEVVASAVIRDMQSLNDDLMLAAASARVLRPEDIFILAPLTQREAIDACLSSFQRVPASIHFVPERLFDGLANIQFGRIGTINSLQLVRKPLTLFEICQKRLFDMVLSGIALVILSPLFALIALAIKLDSRGPVFFLQRRYGFNQEPFRIFKFRSMTTMEDGRIVRQVSRNDVRVTRAGRFMRQTNIDELPQLLNVLRGDMSLVGPRPHAMAHDQLFDRKIVNYARRHNVKSGITGWAQVNGLRGETDTQEKMRMRVEYDLQYVDKWSLWLDIRICFLTVFSRKSYRNAG